MHTITVVGLIDLDDEMLEALGDSTRRRIMRELEEQPMYPAELADRLEADPQRIYYHIRKLEDAGLIIRDREESVSGGTATYYRPASNGFVLGDVDSTDNPIEDILEPMILEDELDGRIVVGSPDKHGPDQVRARDGHLAGEIGMKIGVSSEDRIVYKDTEVIRDELFGSSILMIGGVLTNTVTKKFNKEFPARFHGENFPYREIETPDATYNEESIGIVARTGNPESDGCLVMVAGVSNAGTEAAVRAFKNLEDLLENRRPGEFYVVVRGLDMDGDGEIDQYELVEKGE